MEKVNMYNKKPIKRRIVLLYRHRFQLLILSVLLVLKTYS